MTSIKTRNPRSGEADFSWEPISDTDLDFLCASLRAAQPAWSGGGFAARAGAVQSFLSALDAGKMDVVKALSIDGGYFRPAFGQVMAVQNIGKRLLDVGARLFEDQGAHDTHVPHITARRHFAPYPLAGILSPANFPVSMTMVDLLPAVLAGSAAVVKLSEHAQRVVEPLSRIIESVPALHAVCRIVRGGPEVGGRIVDRVDVVTCTGSIETGRSVAEQAGRRLVPAHLELSGKDAALVLKDADIDRAVKVILRAALSVSGQGCICVERIYVDESVHGAFVDKLMDAARDVTITHPDPHGGQITPFIKDEWAQKVADQLADAVLKGAEIRSGGDIEEHGGKWLRPTILTNVSHDMDVMREESPGPLLPVMAFSSLDQAVELANDCRYGLSATIFSEDVEAANALAKRLEVGGVSINESGVQQGMQAFELNPFQESGLGRSRFGDDSYLRFLRRQAVFTSTGEAAGVETLLDAPPKAPA